MRFADYRGSTIDRCTWAPHLHRSRHHHAGVVRRARGAGIRAGRTGLQHGEIPELLHADHLRLRHGEVLRQRHPRRWLFPQGLHQRRCAIPSHGHWQSKLDHHPEHPGSSPINERTGHNKGVDESLLRHRLRAHSSDSGVLFGGSKRHRSVRRDCQRRCRSAWPRLHSVPCFRQAGVLVLGLASRLHWVLLLQGFGSRSSQHHG